MDGLTEGSFHIGGDSSKAITRYYDCWVGNGTCVGLVDGLTKGAFEAQGLDGGSKEVTEKYYCLVVDVFVCSDHGFIPFTSVVVYLRFLHSDQEFVSEICRRE